MSATSTSVAVMGVTFHLWIKWITRIINWCLHLFADERFLFNIDVVNTPTSLTLISEHDIDSWCCSAFHREDGNLLLGCGNGVKLFRKTDMQITSFNTNHKFVESVVEHGKYVFILYRVGDTGIVEMCLPNITQRIKLFDFQYAGRSLSILTVSEEHVAVANFNTNELYLYNFLTKRTFTAKNDVFLKYIHFLPDGDLLVLDCGPSHLTRYVIKNSQLTPVWVYKDLSAGNRVCADSNGLIHVYTWDGEKKLTIISTEGELVSLTITSKTHTHILYVELKVLKTN